MSRIGIGIERPTRSCGEGYIIAEAKPEPLKARPSDHGAIVGA
jgi:hypothetical protein